MRSFASTPLTRLRPLGIISALWCLSSLAILALPHPEFATASVLFPLSALWHILLLAGASALYTLFQEHLFRERPRMRAAIWGVSLAIALGLFLAARHTGLPQNLLFALASTNLILFALLTGNFIASGLNRPSELVPVCVVMSVADLFSVSAGPSRHIAASIESYYGSGGTGPLPWSDIFLIKVAVPGLAQLQPVFGVADAILCAFLIAAAHRFGIDDNLTGPDLETMIARRRPFPYFPLPAAGLALALFAAQTLGLFLPALPVMALVFLGSALPRHPRMRQLTRPSEWVPVFLGVIFLLGMAFTGIF